MGEKSIKTVSIEMDISSDGNIFLKYGSIEEDYGSFLLGESLTPDGVGLIVQRFIERFNLIPKENENLVHYELLKDINEKTWEYDGQKKGISLEKGLFCYVHDWHGILTLMYDGKAICDLDSQMATEFFHKVEEPK